MKNLLLTVLGIICLLHLSSCTWDTDLNVKISSQKPDIVMISFLSPQDTIIEIFVTESDPVLGPIQDYVDEGMPDAQVRIIKEGGASMPLTYDPIKNKFTLSTLIFPIEEGETYTFEVVATDGRKASGSCTIPSPPPAFLTELDSFQGTLFKTYSIKTKWEDQDGESFYRAYSELEIDFNDFDVLVYQDGTYSPIVISDANNEGKTLFSKAEIEASFSPARVRNLYLNTYLLHTDKAYYQYHRGLSNYSEEDPFTEPTVVYSNIEGGIGVVCGYTLSMKREKIY